MYKPIGLDLIQFERDRVLKKCSIKEDIDFNNECQLMYAIQALSSPIIDKSIARMNKPDKWCSERWEKMINSPYGRRLEIIGQLACAELDRLNYKNK